MDLRQPKCMPKSDCLKSVHFLRQFPESGQSRSGSLLFVTAWIIWIYILRLQLFGKIQLASPQKRAKQGGQWHIAD